jgi:hypothetical protein
VRACPFCAEEIQDAAIVCKHCRRDLLTAPSGVVSLSPFEQEQHRSTTGPPSLPADRSKRRLIVASVIGIALAGVFGWVAERSPDAAAARARDDRKRKERAEFVRQLETAGFLMTRTCTGNEVQVALGGWLALDANAKRDVTGTLAQWCEDQGISRRVKIIDAQSGRTLATYGVSGYEVVQ